MKTKSFNPSAIALDFNNAAYLAHCSQIVYQDKLSLRQELLSLGFSLTSDNFFLSSKEDTQCFVIGDRQIFSIEDYKDAASVVPVLKMEKADE